MKNIIVISIVSVMLFAVSQTCGCGSCKAQTKTSAPQSKEQPQVVTLKITGMSCAGCASHIHTTLSKTNGVIKDEVKYPGDMAIIKYDASKTSVQEIIKAIEKTGYKAEVQKDKEAGKKQS